MNRTRKLPTAEFKANIGPMEIIGSELERAYTNFAGKHVKYFLTNLSLVGKKKTELIYI